jgi:hypothetical protein
MGNTPNMCGAGKAEEGTKRLTFAGLGLRGQSATASVSNARGKQRNYRTRTMGGEPASGVGAGAVAVAAANEARRAEPSITTVRWDSYYIHS